MKTIQDSAAFFFIVAVVILSFVSVFGIWDIFTGDVVWKSFQTLGLLSIVAAVIIKAGNVMNNGNIDAVQSMPNPIFSSLRSISLGVLIISASLLAFLGVLSIWDVIPDKQVLYKSLGTFAVIVFSSAVIKVTCDEMSTSAKLPQ